MNDKLTIEEFSINQDDIGVICTLLLVAGENETYDKFSSLYDALLERQEPEPPSKEQMKLPFNEE